MSTITLMETYDAPMLDTGDLDIAMYSGSSDMWLSVEASMTDHNYDAHLHNPLDQDHHTIEVDMQDHDDGITEYEMTDEAVVYEPSGDDLLDVDVYDASRIHSPLAVPADGANALTPISVPSDVLLTPSPPLPQPSLDAAMPAANSASTREGDSAPLPGGIAQEPAAEDVGPESTGIGEEVAAAVVTEDNLPALPESSLPLPESSLPPSEASLPPPIEVSGVEDKVEEEQIGDEGQPLHQEDKHLSEGTTEQEHDADAVAQEEEVAESEAQSGYYEHQDGDVAYDDSPIYHDDVAHDDTSNYHNGDDAAVEDAATTSDPHEISEGVFIDPPPAVLISLSSDEFPDYSLFNQPSPILDSQQSPTAVATSEGDLALPLLLQSRPTLYYEPLATVFRALREEESLQSLPHFADGEIVLDAYDLQLVISEDNVHSHEVTLHELNVLHDGSDLSGPLRLQLRIVYPRFINRYNALRDEISRLTLAAEDEEGGDSSHIELYPEEETYVQAPHDTLESHEHEQTEREGESTYTHSVPQAEQEVGDSTQQDTLEEHQDANTEESKEQAGEILQLNAATDEDEQNAEVHSNEAGETYDIENVDDTENFEEVGDDTLDAGEIEEGAEYLEYPEYVEDDDERFGEDLPADFGGEGDATNDVYDPHVSLDETAELSEVPDVHDVVPTEDAEDLGDAEGVITVGEHYSDSFPDFENGDDLDETGAEAHVSPVSHDTSSVTLLDSPQVDDISSPRTGVFDVEVSSPQNRRASDVSKPDAHLRKSPSPLSKPYKRGRADSDEEEDLLEVPPGSPDNKRLRME